MAVKINDVHTVVKDPQKMICFFFFFKLACSRIEPALPVCGDHEVLSDFHLFAMPVHPRKYPGIHSNACPYIPENTLVLVLGHPDMEAKFTLKDLSASGRI